MPRTFIPFGQMAPDAGEFGNGNLVLARDVVPVFGGYASCPGMKDVYPVTMAANDVLYGFHSHTNSSREQRYFIATQGRILGFGTATLDGDLTRAAGAYTTNLVTTDGYGGQFYSFGIYVIFTNGNDAIQYRSGDDDLLATKFTTMTNESGGVLAVADGVTLVRPRAQFVSSIKNHLVIANVDLTVGNDTAGVACGGAFDTLAAQRYPELVWWSATDNITRFGSEGATPSLIGTGYQPLYDDYGHITGLAGGEDLYVFKERCIYRMSGPPFTFELISGSVGTTFPNSIVRLGNEIYFWGNAGPCVISGGQVRSLYDGKIDILLNGLGQGINLLNGNKTTAAGAPRPEYRTVIGGASQHSDSVIWTLSGPTPDASSPYDERISYMYNYAYNIKTQAFSRFLLYNDGSFAGDQVYGPVSIGTNFLEVDRISNVVVYPDIVFFRVKSSLFATGGDSYTWATESGDTLVGYGRIQSEPLLITGFIQLSNSASTVVRRVRPVLTTRLVDVDGAHPEGSRPVMHLDIKSRNYPHGPLALDSSYFTGTYYSAQDDHGWINVTSGLSADFHSFALKCPITADTGLFNSDILRFHGLEVEFDTVGLRSKPYA